MIKLLKILGSWLVIFVVFFALCEIGFRLFRKESNPLEAITQKQAERLFRPGQVFHKTSSIPGEFNYTATINCYGYRGKDFAMPKPKGVARIFAVGDSFTFGVGDNDEETIPADLEQQLKAQGLPVEVINAGIGQTSPVRHYVNIRDIHLRYEPDVVVLFFDLTDLWDDWKDEQRAIRSPDGEIQKFNPMFVNGKRDWWVTATFYSAFCRYLNNKPVRSFQKIKVLGFRKYFQAILEGKRAKAVIATSDEKRAQEATMEYDRLLFMRGREKEALIREHWPRTADYLTKIRDLLAARGIPLVIVMYPSGIFVDGEQWGSGRETWGFKRGWTAKDYLAFELMTEYTQKEGIPFINTLDAFLHAPRQKYFFDWDGHMTAAGNRIVANTVAASPVFEKTLKAVLAKSGL